MKRVFVLDRPLYLFNDDYLKSYKRKQEKQKPHQQYTDCWVIRGQSFVEKSESKQEFLRTRTTSLGGERKGRHWPSRGSRGRQQRVLLCHCLSLHLHPRSHPCLPTELWGSRRTAITSYFYLLTYVFSSAGMKPKTPRQLGKNPTTELQPSAFIRKGLGSHINGRGQFQDCPGFVSSLGYIPCSTSSGKMSSLPGPLCNVAFLHVSFL